MSSPQSHSLHSGSTDTTLRLFGALILAAAVLCYASTSEVAWLFLLAYWIFALVVASLIYAFWNRGLSGGLTVVGTESGTGSPMEELPEQLLGSGPRVPVFEGDRMTVQLDSELTLVLPRFKALADRPHAREMEASVAAPRAGSGTEMFGVREYRPGDPLRRIHWRSSARHGELIVREFEPPGVQTLGIFCDPSPPTPEAADQIARIAASEAWDCLRAGGRVVLWSPGAEPSQSNESRSLWSLLEWLARYPYKADELHPQPQRVTDAIAVVSTANPDIEDAFESVRQRGGSVRAWVVGEAEVDLEVPFQRAGIAWPL